MKNHLLSALFFLVPVLVSCTGRPVLPASQTITPQIADTTTVSKGYIFPYDLSAPAEKFKLPDVLTEISGIDVYKKSKLVCVQDEKGKVYVYDVKQGELKKEVDFGKKGDYEGVANVLDTIWVLSSDGNLHRITDFNAPEQQTIEFKTPLNEDNDTEGLCYDEKERRLLIACKNKAGASMKGLRAVYAFDLKTNSISALPAYTIKIDEIKGFLVQHENEKFVTNELKSLLDPKNGDITFQPSEIHVHPITKEIYIISSAGNILLILNRNNTIQYITKLDPALFKQPEGITFMEDGTMYISDEGRDGHGNILKFNYQPNAK